MRFAARSGQISENAGSLSDDQRQLRDLERELAQLLTIYSEDAPQVVTMRRRAEHNTVARIDSCERTIAEQTNVLAVVLNKCRFAEHESGNHS